ncbi:MAG: hypothetical protein ABJB86_17380 [Bacteroidota bacterium]
MKKLESEKDQAQIQILALEDQLGKRLTPSFNSTPVIHFSSVAKANKTS